MKEVRNYLSMEKLTKGGPCLRWLDRSLAVLTSSEKQLPTLFFRFRKLADDALENSAHVRIATWAVSVAGVDAIGALALLASMPFVVHTPLFLLGDGLEAPELVRHQATSEERFKQGGLALSQRFGHLLLHELLERVGVYLCPPNHPRREDDFRVWLPPSILLLVGHR
jgi:hypothetical protein